MEARRVLVYGVTGSGKSHLAARLSERTCIPWHSVDDLTWLPNWQAVPDEEQIATISRICANDEWILDTAYAKWLDIPLERVELIVCLDYPRWVSFTRLFRRTLARAIDRAPVCNGNRETFRQMLSRDSILVWHFKSFARKRRRILRWIAEGREVVHLQSLKQTEHWLSWQ